MKLVLIIIGYAICLLFELPAYIKQERKKLVIYIILMSISLVEAIAIVSLKDLPSFASIIENILGPISKKIYGS